MRHWTFGFCPQVASVLFTLLPLCLLCGVSEGDPAILFQVLVSACISILSTISPSSYFYFIVYYYIFHYCIFHSYNFQLGLFNNFCFFAGIFCLSFDCREFVNDWSIYTMAALKSLSGNFNTWFISSDACCLSFLIQVVVFSALNVMSRPWLFCLSCCDLLFQQAVSLVRLNMQLLANMCRLGSGDGLIIRACKAAAPSLFWPQVFVEDKFSMDQDGGHFGDDSTALHLFPTLFCRHYMNSTPDQQALGLGGWGPRLYGIALLHLDGLCLWSSL